MGEKILPLIFEEIKIRNIHGLDFILENITKQDMHPKGGFAYTTKFLRDSWVYWYENKYIKRRVLVEKDFIKYMQDKC
jgi:hypothetical protein